MQKSIINQDQLSDKQLIDTLKTAVATSKHALMNDGLLLALWGIAFSVGFFWNYLQSEILISSRFRDLMTILKPAVSIALIAFTIYFIIFRPKKVKTYTAISTRFVWLGIIIAHNLNVTITQVFLAEVSFELLHPLQMVLIGFALFVTGGIYRYNLLSFSGVLMWIAALFCIRHDLNTQFLIRAIADLLCFVVPGFVMLLSIKKPVHVQNP